MVASASTMATESRAVPIASNLQPCIKRCSADSETLQDTGQAALAARLLTIRYVGRQLPSHLSTQPRKQHFHHHSACCSQTGSGCWRNEEWNGCPLCVRLARMSDTCMLDPGLMHQRAQRECVLPGRAARACCQGSTGMCGRK